MPIIKGLDNGDEGALETWRVEFADSGVGEFDLSEPPEGDAMRWPIRIQLLLWILSVVVFGIVTATAASAYLAVREASRQQAGNLQRVVDTLTEATYPLSQTVLEHMSGLSGGRFLVLDRRGQAVYSTIEVGAADLVAFESLEKQRSADLFSEANVVRLADRAYFSDVVAVSRGSWDPEPRRLVVLYPKDRWWSVARRVASPILLAGAATTLAAMLVSVVVAARFVRPVRVLRNQAEAIAAGRFQPVEVPRRNDEIGDLALSINSMTEKLSRYESEVRRSERLRTLAQLGFGIAHQLRNSATGARMAIEFCQREVRASAGAESLAMALRQLQLMETHLQRFMALGRSEPVSYEQVALEAVVEEVLDLVRPTCDHAKIRLSAPCPDRPIFVHGDAHSLGQLLTNLVVNAIDAAGRRVESGAEVVVELGERDGTQAVLRVKDSGPGPGEAVRDRLFEPFVTDKPDGTGLGLYLARQVAEAHDGTIRWERRDDMTCFTVELPLINTPRVPTH